MKVYSTFDYKKIRCLGSQDRLHLPLNIRQEKIMIQHFKSDKFGQVTFTDKRAQVSIICQPRDIKIVSGDNCEALREEIALDIRLGQGQDSIGIARDLRH